MVVFGIAIGIEETYPTAVRLNRRSILPVVCDQGAGDGGDNGIRRDVSQAGTEFEGFALSGAGWQ